MFEILKEQFQHVEASYEGNKATFEIQVRVAIPMPRRNRVSRDRQSAQKGVPASPHIRRKLPFFEVLDEEGLVKLEAQVDWIIQDVGLAFRDDPEALRIWKQAGARIDGDIVRAPADWLRSLCKTAPAQFTQLARNRERSVIIGGNNQVFAPIYGAPFVRDLESGRRYGDIESFRKLVKISYMHPNLHHGGFVTCEPCDLPVSKRHFDMLLAHMTLSDKPHLGAITEMSRAQDSVDMAEIVFGKQVMDENCVIMGNVNTNSPLLIDKVVTEAIRVYSSRGQGIIVVPFILSGAMGPVSTAASVTQAMAEATMVCAFSQLVKPGAPFVLGNFLSSMSLKSGAPTFGMPEPVISNYVVGQLARRMRLPLRCGGSLTASKIEDAQAAYESADSMHSTMLAGANDSDSHARALVKCLKGVPAKVNLIPFNPFPTTRYRRSEESRIDRFFEILNRAGIVTITRRTRGDDIDAACGQLAGRFQDRTRRRERVIANFQVQDHAN